MYQHVSAPHVVVDQINFKKIIFTTSDNNVDKVAADYLLLHTVIFVINPIKGVCIHEKTWSKLLAFIKFFFFSTWKKRPVKICLTTAYCTRKYFKFRTSTYFLLLNVYLWLIFLLEDK